ncbi:hypothetical protein Tco_1167255 [Tanacetum coccineum]
MMRSFCSVDESVANISYPSTNKAFETPEDSPDLEPSLNKLYKLLTPPFIIFIPNPVLHAKISPASSFSDCFYLCRLQPSVGNHLGLGRLIFLLIALNTELQVFHALSDDYVPSPQVDYGG